MRFEDKTVLITGAAGGIGQTILAPFAGHGARVAVTGREIAKLTTVSARFDGGRMSKLEALP